MAEPVKAKRLDFGGTAPDDARAAIKTLFASEPEAVGKVYAALAHKVWTLLVERRLDSEIRDWHALLHGVRASVRTRDEKISERFAALADLVRESISLAETSPARDVARRPHARRILEILADADAFVPRRELMHALGLKTANLSNVLSQLAALSLVERRDKGKEAEFRITARGREMSGLDAGDDQASRKLVRALLDMRVHLIGTGEPSRQGVAELIGRYPISDLFLPVGVHDVAVAAETANDETFDTLGFGKSRHLSRALVSAGRGSDWRSPRSVPTRLRF